MSDHHIKRSRRDVLEDLKQQGRFLECFLLAWGIIEMRSSEQILRAHGLSSQNPKSKSLLALSVGKKLKCLKELDYLSNEEYQTVIEFKEKRNDLFHTGALFVVHIDQTKKERIMDMGIRAADVMHDLAERPMKPSEP
jgi:hypothetical protein